MVAPQASVEEGGDGVHVELLLMKLHDALQGSDGAAMKESRKRKRSASTSGTPKADETKANGTAGEVNAKKQKQPKKKKQKKEGSTTTSSEKQLDVRVGSDAHR